MSKGGGLEEITTTIIQKWLTESQYEHIRTTEHFLKSMRDAEMGAASEELSRMLKTGSTEPSAPSESRSPYRQTYSEQYSDPYRRNHSHDPQQSRTASQPVNTDRFALGTRPTFSSQPAMQPQATAKKAVQPKVVAASIPDKLAATVSLFKMASLRVGHDSLIKFISAQDEGLQEQFWLEFITTTLYELNKKDTVHDGVISKTNKCIQSWLNNTDVPRSWEYLFEKMELHFGVTQDKQQMIEEYKQALLKA
ncbi:hypothetical protein D5018_09155 [Parashewanella curva]|uniref:Uncharacterized protein n=1 Tax=Parashewanella curva TaxID=2338552 RepID=A0A3L8PXH1_9GAMM|nr:hypothetical protein [Parashewanella curva]RLV59965.1 hypothetical protein D5018_09155 [Parashewanella curva]